jgi:futalosine hydrolase
VPARSGRKHAAQLLERHGVAVFDTRHKFDTPAEAVCLELLFFTVLNWSPLHFVIFRSYVMPPVIVTASTMMELSQLIEAAGASPVSGTGHLPLYRGSVAEREVLLAVTGIGKVNAACAATLLLERFRPAFLINTGCGGAFPGSGLSLGDLAVASSETFADEGVETPEGWRGLELIGIPLCEVAGEPVFNTIPMPRHLCEEALSCARGGGFNAEPGPFLTVSTCSGTKLKGEELLHRFPGICENMEGAALAQVALSYGVPLLEVRGISNFVEDRNLARWDLKRAVGEVQGFLSSFLELSASR